MGGIIMKQFNLDEYLKNPSRKVVTRDGLNARIICTDRKDLKYPIVALIETKSGGEFLQYYTKDGTYFVDDLCDADLLFLPEKHEGWINLHKNEQGRVFPSYIYQTEEDAEKYGIGNDNYITTVKIEWED